jgi:hypothetical protein
MREIPYPPFFNQIVRDAYPGNPVVEKMLADKDPALGDLLAQDHKKPGLPDPNSPFGLWCTIEDQSHSPKPFDEIRPQNSISLQFHPKTPLPRPEPSQQQSFNAFPPPIDTDYDVFAL